MHQIKCYQCLRHESGICDTHASNKNCLTYLGRKGTGIAVEGRVTKNDISITLVRLIMDLVDAQIKLNEIKNRWFVFGRDRKILLLEQSVYALNEDIKHCFRMLSDSNYSYYQG